MKKQKRMTYDDFKALWNSSCSNRTHAVINNAGITVINHGESECNKIAQWMIEYHKETFTVIAR